MTGDSKIKKTSNTVGKTNENFYSLLGKHRQLLFCPPSPTAPCPEQIFKLVSPSFSHLLLGLPM